MHQVKRSLLVARYGLPALIAALVFLCFLPVLGNDFVNWDDPYTLSGNPNYKGLSLVHLKWMFTTLYMGHYQPLSWVTHALVYAVWGMNPTGYHLVNLLLHAANGVVFYFLVAALLRHAWDAEPQRSALSVHAAAAIGALLFALHPLRVEAVAWATERREVLCGFFLLLTLLTYVRMHDEQTHGGVWRGWFLLSLGCYLLSLLSKATGMTLPVVLLAADYYPLRRCAGRSARRASINCSAPRYAAKRRRLLGVTGLTSSTKHPEIRSPRVGPVFSGAVSRGCLEENRQSPRAETVTALLLEKVPYALLACSAATVAFHGVERGAMVSLARHGSLQRVTQAAYGLCFYLWKTVVPFRLSPLYLLEEPLDPTRPQYVLCMVTVVLITAAAIILRRRSPWLLVAWTSYVVVVSPVLGLVQAGPQLVADRYSYLSCLPWAVLAGAGVCRLWLACEERRLSMLAGGAVGMGLAAVLAVLGVQSHQQARVWKDSLTLWSHVLQLDPTNYIAYNSRGDARLVPSASPSTCRVAGDLAGAVADYSQAVQFAPPAARSRLTFERNLAAARQQVAACGTHQHESVPRGAE